MTKTPKKEAPAKKPKEQVFEGLAAAPGIAIGKAFVRFGDDIEVQTYAVAKTKIADELKRLDSAVKVARRQIRSLQERAREMQGAAGEELVILFDAYLAMLEDSRLVRGARQSIERDRINAEAAVQQEFRSLAKRFEAMADAYIAARLDDIREVATRLIGILVRAPGKAPPKPPKGGIVVADQLSPADMAQIDPLSVAAVAAVLGGTEGHTAIMARALGLPAVLGAAGLADGVMQGDTVIVDGYAGKIVVAPTPETVRKYEKRLAAKRKGARALDRLRFEPAISRDGTEVQLMANVELPVEMEAVHHSGAQGVGLLRSEFMFMNRDDIPSEDEQTAILKQIVAPMKFLPVTIRTLDIGGEKPAPALLSNIDEAAASALGLRGIRLSLANPDTLRTQFRAILRVASNRNVRILLPMVTTPSEVKRAKAMLAEEAEKLKAEGHELHTPLPPVGVMIEVPGAALAADSLARASDFFAIGSNDLTMYTLAVDRANEHVAHLFNSLHPAVLRLVQFTTQAALRARIPVSICGEIAGDPRYTALLIGLGLNDLSMTASNIPLVKKRIRDMDALAASQRALQIMEQTDSGRIAMMIDDFNEVGR
ncbi:phosphoenolpyruvate--protein phosphotransferase [Thalassospiraceae bacterium LMO-JJ14]|nr:phosphoenolpyruvate--protein phosphotransferase [Thalassospiraceae bacterium LMO-JJ14]